MKHRSAGLVLSVLLSLALVLVQGCATVPEPRSDSLSLTIVHLNDTHSHLDPTDVTLTVNAEPVKVPLGGFPRLKTAIDGLRGSERNLLFLHAGDMVQGTLYFTKYGGKADIDFMNLVGVDVMCPGNHEFDRGPALLSGIIDGVKFPVVSANIDASKEPLLSAKLPPFTVKKVGDAEVGIIGLTTVETPVVSNPGRNLRFEDPAGSVQKAVDALHALGVKRIVLVSHSGYEEDIALARKVPGVSVIVGGHTHSLLGDSRLFGALGLKPEGPYPTVVRNPLGRNVLIVQSWEWAKILGVLRVTLNAEGEPTEWSGSPKLMAGTPFRKNGITIPAGSDAHAGILRSLQQTGLVAFYDENPDAKGLLSTYAAPLQEMMRTNVADAAEDLVRGDNAGPGPLVADAMLWKTRASGAQIAIQNTGGIRRDIPAGSVSVAAVYELLPFNNTLVLLDLTGSELKAALEEAVDYQMATGSKSPYLYVAGATFGIAVSGQKGSRITNLRVKLTGDGYVPVDPAKTYRIVTNNYLARGGDGMQTFGRAAGYRIDTGFTDAEVFLDFLKGIGTIQSPKEKRISSVSQTGREGCSFSIRASELPKAA